jgi:indolepyruvate ferredoxin oxidoreductase, beta subunit
MAKLAGRVKRLIALDATSLALRAGSSLSLNMVMLGALAGSGATDVAPDRFRAAMTDKTKAAFAGINLQAFDLGARAAGQG